MQRYGYTFIKPVRGNGKFSDFRAFLFAGGFFFWLAAAILDGWGGVFFGISIAPILVMYFFAYLAEDLPVAGLSLLVVSSALSVILCAWLLFDGSISKRYSLIIATTFVGITLPWSVMLLCSYRKSMGRQHNN